MPTVYKRVILKETDEKLLSMRRSTVIRPLTDKEVSFCERYVQTHNLKMSAVHAGFSPASSHVVGWKLRQKYYTVRYIRWLKLRVATDCHLSAVDMINHYMKIAFSDMNDFIQVKDGKITVKDSEQVDGQLIKKLKRGRDGITIELEDRRWALDKLEQYFDVMPMSWREKVELAKIEIAKQRLELDKLIHNQGDIDEVEDDGFDEALAKAAKGVWADEEE